MVVNILLYVALHPHKTKDVCPLSFSYCLYHIWT